MKPDQYYTDVIARPMVRKTGTNREIEVVAEDEQSFLSRQQQYLQQGGVQPTATSSVQKTPDRKTVGSPGVQGSPKKMEAGKPGVPGGQSSEGVLANFFNSLLSKKTGQGAIGPGGAPGVPVKPTDEIDKAAVRSDAAAELDRLTRKKGTNSSGPESLNNSSDC